MRICTLSKLDANHSVKNWSRVFSPIVVDHFLEEHQLHNYTGKRESDVVSVQLALMKTEQFSSCKNMPTLTDSLVSGELRWTSFNPWPSTQKDTSLSGCQSTTASWVNVHVCKCNIRILNMYGTYQLFE